MKDDAIDRIVSRWSDEYRRQAGPFIARLKELLAQGMPIRQAVNQAFADTGFFGKIADELKQSLGAAAGSGYGAKLTIATKKTIGEKLFLLPWTADKMPLSTRLHGVADAMRQSIAQTIQGQMQAGTNWVQMARKLYDGYGFPETIRRAELPQYLQSLVKAAQKANPSDLEAVREVKRLARIASRNLDKLGKNGAPNRSLKAAYKQLTEVAEKGSAKALEHAVAVAIHERSRYYAERIARTEISRAFSEGFWVKHYADPDVVAAKWRLSSRHPKYDICDFHAKADLYGMGPGVYPKNSSPPHPAHPHCTCRLTPVYDGEVDPPREQIQAGGNDFLKTLEDRQLQDLLGIDGVKAWKRGENWQPYLREWRGHEDPRPRLETADFLGQLPQSRNDVKMDSMREFKKIGAMPSKVFSVLSGSYQIQDAGIHISGDTIDHIVSEHPEFDEEKIPAIIQDLVDNAIMIQRNKRDDTVRIIAKNDQLHERVEKLPADVYLYLIMRLSNNHDVNFVKSLHPRSKLKKGELLWPKSKE